MTDDERARRRASLTVGGVFLGILNSAYLHWALLALPGIPMIASVFSGHLPANVMLVVSGDFSAQLMIAAMAITPLGVVFERSSWVAWLRRRRRYLGVAAFAYALLHTLFFLADVAARESGRSGFDQAYVLGLFTGWIAFVLLVPMALTSNQAAVRKLGVWWKRLQRIVYAVAVLTLLHWLFLDQSMIRALAHFAPLAALEGYRLWKTIREQ